MTVVSKLKLNHPPLGDEGGSALHTSVEAIYQKVGDSINSRFFVYENLADTASIDFDHNFITDFANLRIDLYAYNDVTDEITLITDLSDWVIAEKVGNETTHVRVTNNTGSVQDIGIIIMLDPIKLGNLKNVDVPTPEDGQALVFDSATGKWKAGASGDASFKFQSLNAGILTVKKGFLFLSSKEELYAANDILITLASYISSDGAYYGYIDRLRLGQPAIVGGRKLVAVDDTMWLFSTTSPDNINSSRYIGVGIVVRAGGVFTTFATLATRLHDVALGVDGSLEHTVSYTALGDIGSIGQRKAGHVLTSNSFPVAAYAATSFFNLAANPNDGNTTLGKNLTNDNAALFNADDILGSVNAAATLNGTNQRFSSTNAHFDPQDLGNTIDFTAGGWFKATNWAAAAGLFGQWVAAALSFAVGVDASGYPYVKATTDGATASQATSDTALTGTGWHHFAVRYIAASNKFELKVDGDLVATLTLGANLYNAGASRVFTLGSHHSAAYFAGVVSNFMFCNGTAYTDSQLSKIWAAKETHYRTISTESQLWWLWVKGEGIQRNALDRVVDINSDELYYNLFDMPATNEIAMKLYNGGAGGASKPSKPRELELTVDQLDAMLPLSHGLGAVPVIQFKVKNIDGDYETLNSGSYFLLTATQIKLAGASLVSLFGTGVTVLLNYSTGNLSQFVPNRFWNSYVTSSNQGVAVNDQAIFNTTGGAKTATLPASPACGDKVLLVDGRSNFGVNALTLDRNGKLINGAASNFDCDVSGAVYTATFIDDTFGWLISF
jgi:hypothetical protein